MFLEILQNSRENTCARVSFLIKLQASDLQLYWKRDFGTGVFQWQSFFLWILALVATSESNHYSLFEPKNLFLSSIYLRITIFARFLTIISKLPQQQKKELFLYSCVFSHFKCLHILHFELLYRVLGKLPPSPNCNANPKLNACPNRRAISLGGNFPDTLQIYQGRENRFIYFKN